MSERILKKIIHLVIIFFLIVFSFYKAKANQSEFENWLADFKKEARKEGISQNTINKALRDVTYHEKIIKKDKNQAEFVKTFGDYYKSALDASRIKVGKKMMRKYKTLLANVESKYKVQPRFIVAFWGMETFYGKLKGKNNVFDALATLAYDNRRGAYFTKELINALKIMDKNYAYLDWMKGSWAGAMGHFQFMPSTLLHYGEDVTNNGSLNVWTDIRDAMHSAGNYLHSMNWKGDEKWGREVILPKNFNWDLVDLDVKKSLRDWNKLGVRKTNGANLPKVSNMKAALVAPTGSKGPIFLVYDNFFTIMRWNRSIFYAISVGRLADRIIGYPKLKNEVNVYEKALTKNEVKYAQERLKSMGFYKGKIDGILGKNMRLAVKKLQRKLNLTQDGYLDFGLLQKLKK